MRQHTAAITLFLLGGVFVLGLLALACGEEEAETPTPVPSPPLPSPTPTTFTVHFIDVGQGDATLIEADGTVILVDGGDASANVEDYLQAQGIQDIDLMVATHPHADHIGGLIDVLELYDVHEIWTNGATSGSQTYGNFALAVTAEGATERELTRGYSAQMGGLEIAVLHPGMPLSGDLNEDSLVLQISCGEVDLLLTGDATTDSEASMLAGAGLLTDVEILKVGHHGSNTSTSGAFLDEATPEDAVISVGAGNTYGHPHQETLDRLTAHAVTVYRTDLDGTITLTSDCNTYSIAMSGPAPTPTPTPTSTPAVVPPECAPPAQPFVIEPEESFEVAMKLDEPTLIRAEATWEIGPGQLSLFLNGPDRPELPNPQAPYERRDGPSGPLVLEYSTTASDIERGSDWRVRVANFGSEIAAGCLLVEKTPSSSATPMATPTSPSGLYRVTYTKTADSCGTFVEVWKDVLDIHVEDETIAIHQERTGEDTAGIIDPDHSFMTSGFGPTYHESYQGRLEQGRIEAVNTYRRLGCNVEYSVSGERQ